MDTTEKTIEVLNDLIHINNDRAIGYEKAVSELSANDVDLKTLFSRLATDSHNYINELSEHVAKLGGKVAQGDTNPGIIYHAWMTLKATFTGNDRKSILESCEFGEDAAQRAYGKALLSDAKLSGDTGLLVSRQKTHLKEVHDEIKELRDKTKAGSMTE